MPALVTAVLFRDPRSGAAAFAQNAGYLFDDDAQSHAGDPRPGSWSDVGRRTVECTKKMLGLKVWACLRAYGVDFFRDHLRACCDKTALLARLIGEHEELEVLTPPEANILCFRAKAKGGGENAAIRKAIVDDGDVYCVQVHLHALGLAKERTGLWLRTTILNPRTTEATLRSFVDDVVARSS
jgi:L-2,4-diaminobutyrate decarboxylase